MDNTEHVASGRDGSTGALVMGILSAVFSFIVIGIVFSIIGLVKGIKALVRETPYKGKAIAGVVLSSAGLIIAIIMCSALGSSNDSNKGDANVNASMAKESVTDKYTAEKEEAVPAQDTQYEKPASSAPKITIEEQIVFDQDGIVITATGIEDGWIGTELKLLIENNSGKSITVQARNANVNGYMVSTTMSADVADGKKANTELTFLTSGLKDSGIEKIAHMEFIFHIFESETWDDIVDTDVISIDTSIADSYVQTVDDTGVLLVDTAGIKIICKGLSKTDSFWGPGVVLYIENNSNRDFTVQVRDVSINGYMVTSTMSEDVIVGRRAISAVQFFSSDLEDNSITDINEVELYFHVFDMNTWGAIYDSDVITLQIN